MKPYAYTPDKRKPVPYHEDDQEYTLHPVMGQHDQIDVDRAIFWLHSVDHTKKTTVVWQRPAETSSDK